MKKAGGGGGSPHEELKGMLRQAHEKNAFVRDVEQLIQTTPASGVVVVFPNTSFDRKLVHLLCRVHNVESKTDKRKAFHEVLYSPNCVVGCGCDTVRLCQYPVVLTLPREKAVSFQPFLPTAKQKRVKNSVYCPPPPPPDDDGGGGSSLWSRLPGPAVVCVMMNLSLRGAARMLQVCRGWRNQGDVAIFWKAMYMRMLRGEQPDYQQMEECKKKAHSATATTTSKRDQSFWKLLCKDIAPIKSKCGCGVRIRHNHGEMRDFETTYFCSEGRQYL